MKKIILPLIACLSIGSCKKSASPAIPPSLICEYAGLSSYAGGPLTIAGNDSVLAECIYHPNNPTGGYLFVFRDSTRTDDGIQFVIEGDSLGKIVINKPFTYSYSRERLYNLSVECRMFINLYNISITGQDSAAVTAIISRYSNGTMDGSFSETIWQSPSDSVAISSGYFFRVPLINQ